MTERMLDEFAFILAALLIFVFGGSIYLLNQQIMIKQAEKIEEKIETLEISLGVFEVSAINQTKKIFEKESFKVEQGFFGGISKNIVFYLKEKNNLLFEFQVDETNLEAPLSIFVNDKLFLSKKFEPGIYSFTIPGNLLKKGNNVITFSTHPPGWKFWMRSVYIISNVKLEIPEIAKKEKEFSFSIPPNILENCTSSVLRMFKLESIDTSELVIILNQQEIYRKIPFSKKFDVQIPCYLLKPNNVIKFATVEEAYFKINGKIFVNYIK